MKTSLTSAALFPLLSLALLSSCDRSVSTVSSENGSVAVVPRFAAASVPAASRLEARLSASGQPDSVVNVAYQKGGDLELGSVPSGASFTVSMTGYDSSLSQRVVRWAGSGSGTADGGSATKYVDISTVSGPSVPSLTIGSTAVPQTLPLAGMWYTTNGTDPRIVSKATKATGDVVINSACTVRAARDTVIAGDTLWSDTVSWTFTAAGTAPAAHDSTLSSLTLNGTTVSGFVAGMAGADSRVYTDSVAAGVTSATLAATATETDSKVSDTGVVSLSLTDPNVKTITVTNANGNTLVYTAKIYHKVAVAPPPQYKLTVTQLAGGTIAPTGGTYDSGTIVTATATATASSGYTFSGWTGACTGMSSTCTVIVTKDTTLSATFTKTASTDTTLSSLKVSVGKLSPNFASKTTNYHDTVGSTAISETIHATVMATGASVSGDTGVVSLNTILAGDSVIKTITVTNGGKSLAYTVVIVKRALPKYTLTVSSSPATGGTIALSPTGGTYDSGTTVIATATASSGYMFSAWSGACTSTISACTLSVTKALALSTNFIPSGPGMKLIPAGTFTMGSPTTEVNRSPGETQHRVTLSSFYMDSTDVTQGQYLAVMGVNPSIFTSCGTACPVENVTWFDAVLYCNARSKKAGLDTVYSYTAMTGTYGNGVTALTDIAASLSKRGYRLPTDAQWEYAARGGATTAYYWGEDTAAVTVSKYAWYSSNASNTTHPVATKLPNPYGLYDMAGNVWQWTNDRYGASYDAATDPSGPSTGTNRVQRGGGWIDEVSYLRSAFRASMSPDYLDNTGGFRSVRPGS